jgi:hypothetical protein
MPRDPAEFLKLDIVRRERLSGMRAMPIRAHLSGGTFEPQDIEAMSLAFEEVCKALEIHPGANVRGKPLRSESSSYAAEANAGRTA